MVADRHAPVIQKRARGVDNCPWLNRIVTNDIKKAKAAYNRHLIDESGGDPKTFWKTMKKILPGEKRATHPNISVNRSETSDKR